MRVGEGRERGSYYVFIFSGQGEGYKKREHVGEVYSGSLPATLPLQPLTPSTSQRLVLLPNIARLYKDRLTWT